MATNKKSWKRNANFRLLIQLFPAFLFWIILSSGKALSSINGNGKPNANEIVHFTQRKYPKIERDSTDSAFKTDQSILANSLTFQDHGTIPGIQFNPPTANDQSTENSYGSSLLPKSLDSMKVVSSYYPTQKKLDLRQFQKNKHPGGDNREYNSLILDRFLSHVNSVPFDAQSEDNSLSVAPFSSNSNNPDLLFSQLDMEYASKKQELKGLSDYKSNIVSENIYQPPQLLQNSHDSVSKQAQTPTPGSLSSIPPTPLSPTFSINSQPVRSPSPPPPPPPPPLPEQFSIGAQKHQRLDPLFEPIDKKKQDSFINDLVKIKLVSDVIPAPFRKNDQKYEFEFARSKYQNLNNYRMKNLAITREKFRENHVKLDEKASEEQDQKQNQSQNQNASLSKKAEEDDIEMQPLPLGPPIPGTEPGIEGLSHIIPMDKVPLRPQKRQDEWDCITSQVERDKTTWKVERGKMRFNYIPKFSEISPSLFPLSGDAKSLYQNCISALRTLENRQIITSPSNDEVESEFLRTTFCISAAVYCYTETALGDPELQLYWNREVRAITDSLVARDPNVDLLQVVGESLASNSESRVGSSGISSFDRLPNFMPQRMPNQSFSLVPTKLEECPSRNRKANQEENDYEGGLAAALSTNINEVVVDDPEIWTMWRAIITQQDRDLNMNLKRFKIFSKDFPTKFSSDTKPKKMSELRNLCVDLIKEGIRENPPRYELLPMAKPNEEQVLNEFCNYSADYYFGNRQWSYIFEFSSNSPFKMPSNTTIVYGLPKYRPYAPFRYFAAETFNEMRINCCSVIYDLFLSKVFPHISTSYYKDKGTSMDKSKLERFCHEAARKYFNKDISDFDSRLKNVGYFDFTSYKSRVTNYKEVSYQSLLFEGAQDLESTPGYFSVGSIDNNLSYTPRFPNLKPTRVCFSQWKAILDQNKEDLKNNVETPTHLPEAIPNEWNMPQFSRATFRIACFRIIRKLYREGSVSVRSSVLKPISTEQNMEKILSEFCLESSKRYFDGLNTDYSMENLLQIQTDTESQWNSVVEAVMRLQESKKSTTIYWIYPVPPESYVLSSFRYNVNPSPEDEEEEEKIKKSFWRSREGEVGYETRCIESLKFYITKREEELMKMEVDTNDMALVELAIRKVCEEAADTFFGAIEWIWMYKLSNVDNINKYATWIPAVTGLPRRRPISSLLNYKGTGNIVQFRDYCFAFIWTLWKSGNEPDLRISGKLYSSGEGNLVEQKVQLERWCTHVANEAYNSGYKLSKEQKKKEGIVDLGPRMDPQTSLSAVEHNNKTEQENSQVKEGETVVFSLGDASSQWKMILSQVEVDRRRNIRRVIWLPEYAEIKEYFPGSVERRHFVPACIQILHGLSEKGLLEWGTVSPEYQGVIAREFCSDAFMNGYEQKDDSSNPISALYGERQENRELLIEFLKFMHKNKMNIRKWILFYLNENLNLEYAITWALNEDNWGYLSDYFQQAQIHEPDNFNQLFEEVRERVRQMGGFLDAGEDEYFSNNINSRENLWKAIYNQMHIDLLLGRQQRISNLPLSPPDIWLGSRSPEEFVPDCKRVITMLQGQTNPELPSSKELTLKEILTAVRVFGSGDKDESEILDSYCKDVFLHISDKKGLSIFKGSGFSYPGAILEFERNRQWGVIANLATKYSKLQQRDIEGKIGPVSRIDKIPGFVRHTIFQGSYDMEEFLSQCEIALQTLATDINIPSNQKVVFPDLQKNENVEDIIKEYCRTASEYVFQEKMDHALNEDAIDEVAVLNDLDNVSRRFRLRNPLGLDYKKRWNSIIDLAKKRIDEEKYLRMNRVLGIDSAWLKNVYPEIAGQDLKNAFDSKDNNHLASFILVSYELFSAIMLGKEGNEKSNKDKFQFISRKTLLQFCRDVCYKYFTDEARGDVNYSNQDKSATEYALILDMIATRPRIGPDPRDPLYELYPEQGEEVPELNSFNMDQYITSRWEIYKKDFEDDNFRNSMRKNIMDSLNSAEINLLNPKSGKPGSIKNNVVWAPTAPYPWKHHIANKNIPSENMHDSYSGTILAGKTLEHMKSIFGGNIADVAKTTIIPKIPNLNSESQNSKPVNQNGGDSTKNIGGSGRILPLGDYGETAKVKRIKVGTRGGKVVNSKKVDHTEDKFDQIEREYKELVSNNLISQGTGGTEGENEEENIIKGIKPRNRSNPDRIPQQSKRKTRPSREKSGPSSDASISEGTPEKSSKKNAITKEELASSRLADREWTVISQLGKLLPASEGSNLVAGIPIERPKDLYPKSMGNVRAMTEACFSVISNAKFRAISGTRISGKTKEERKHNANFYCRKAAEAYYESIDGDFIPPESLKTLPGFQGLYSPIGKSKATRGRGSRVFLGESSKNPMGKEVGLKPLHKESARIRKSFGPVVGSYGLNTHMHNQSNSLQNTYKKMTGDESIVMGGFALNAKISGVKRNIIADSGNHIREKLVLSPGDDLLTDPDYYNDMKVTNSQDSYVEMRPSKGLGSGIPKPGKLHKKSKDGNPKVYHIQPRADPKEERKIKAQLVNQLNQFSKVAQPVNRNHFRNK
ncbi:uncharacterized protein cubi_00121 [Cryptosporidium ubiquitum]|uniref:Uncharacterized protein n=1 Tax=Cryptosporidium ubiquitum TaxID=857276 RepID=A0A1J4MK17_9CRYT|nr:uncharacterized protein cubi_00121 [Cryptosporidium ubiquitum]OII74568.1 hypothetical protein cubi_00121 [Cryptosporidium ubiquitum]